MQNQGSGTVPLSQSQVSAKHFYRFKYLKSDHWDNLRIAKLAEVDAVCWYCRHRDLSNDVHHVNYRNLYDVELSDLLVLCRRCHNMAHYCLDYFRERLKATRKTKEFLKKFMYVCERAIELEIDLSSLKDHDPNKRYNRAWRMVRSEMITRFGTYGDGCRSLLTKKIR